MTVIEGSVADIGMSPMSGTLFARPVTMRREGNTVITTERTPFHIDGGVLVDVDLVPGPAMLSIEVGTHVRRNFRVTVPPSGPIQLADLLEDAYEYTPEVVSVVAGYRNETFAARNDACAARDAAQGSADDADASAGDSAGSATASAQSATAAATARDAAQAAQAGAETAEVGAEAARTGAETARVGAEQAEADAVAALSGLSTRVTTVEGALPSKADLVGGRVDPAQLVGSGVSGTGIRVDKTVGTRVFVGETMIYGDTGWRDVSSLCNSSMVDLSIVAGRIRMQRVNAQVHLAFRFATARALSVVDDWFELPNGFMPEVDYRSLGFTSAGVHVTNNGSPQRLRFDKPVPTGTAVTGTVVFGVSGRDVHVWPTALPGMPV